MCCLEYLRVLSRQSFIRRVPFRKSSLELLQSKSLSLGKLPAKEIQTEGSVGFKYWDLSNLRSRDPLHRVETGHE